MLGRLTSNLLGLRAAEAPARGAAYLERFDRQFAPRLGMRAESLRLMMSLLEARTRSVERPLLIIETGSVRQPGNWEGDGQSTVLWGDFANHFDAEVHTVDLDPEPARLINGELALGDTVKAHTGDSVKFLHDLATARPLRQIDLLYLDSYDLDVQNPYPSALHHLKELAAARPSLGPGSVVAVDDNHLLETGGYLGKGLLVEEWFSQVGIKPLYSGYQFIWQL